MIALKTSILPFFHHFHLYWDEEKRNNEKRGGEIIIERGKIEWAIIEFRIDRPCFEPNSVTTEMKFPAF